MARYIWLLCDPSASSLWANWTHVNLLGRSQFWIAKVPWDCSWTWRKILQLRPLIKPFISYVVGNGRSLSLWFDPWLPTGSICSTLDARVIYDSGLPKFAKVAAIIDDRSWAWPGVNTMELMDLRHFSLSLPLPNPSIEDKVVWNSVRGKSFSVRDAWNLLREHYDKVDWYSIVWFKNHVPRHSFILWLGIRHRLSTHDRLLNHGLAHPSRCVLCCQDSESHSHLFFQCPYSARLWFALLTKLGLQCYAATWDDIICWSTIHLSGSSLLHLLGRLSFAALVYFIWRERNSRLHDQPSLDAVCLLRHVESSVRLRILSCKSFARTDANRHLVRVWCLPPSVLSD